MIGSTLSSAFQKAAGFIFNKHTLIHGVFMLGMIFPGIDAGASIAGVTATFGDIGVGAFEMAKSMITGWGDGVGILTDAFSNAANGAWASQSLDLATHGQNAAEALSHIATAADKATYEAAAATWGASASGLTAAMLNHE